MIQFCKNLNECINSNLPVFSRDIGKNGEKAFFVCEYNYFIKKYYKNLKQKHVYEVVQFDKPTKLFIDFDCKKINKVQEFNIEINNVIDDVKQKCIHLFNVCPEFIILDSTSNNKLSKHLIFDIVFQNVAQIKAFIFENLNETKFLDKGIYTRNRSFRLVFSSKKEKNIKLLPLNQSSDYNESVVKNTLLQFIPHNFNIYEYNFENLQSVKLLNNCIPNNNTCVIGTEVSTKESEEFIHVILKNMYCPFSQKIHKSNNTYYTTIKKTGLSWFKCADPECPPIMFGKHYVQLSSSHSSCGSSSSHFTR